MNVVACAVAAGLCVVTAGCRCDDGTEEQPAAAEQPVAPRCEVVAGPQFTIRGAESNTASAQAAKQAASRPFSVELGPTVVGQGTAIVPFLRPDQGETTAQLALVELASLQVRIVELGAVVGSPAPPKVALRGTDRVAVVAEGSAVGVQYRLARFSAQPPDWFGEASEVGDDSPAFDLALAGDRTVLVWDDWDREQGLGVIRLAAFGKQRTSAGVSPTTVSPAGTDAESPRLWARPGGYWLAWIALGKPADKPPPMTENDEEIAPLAVTASWLELLKVDDGGVPLGQPLRVTPTDGHVVAYDAVAGHDGSLLLALRDDAQMGEMDDAEIRLLRVNDGGVVDSRTVETPNLGASAPSLVFDSDPGQGAPHGWLVLASAAGQTMFAALTPFGELLEPVAPHPVIGTASVLGAHRGQLLLAQPRGKHSVLSLASCRVVASVDAGQP